MLPFSNISPDPKDEYFADGMTEELISTISRISGLMIIARTSIMGYKGGQKKISEIARELDVGTIVEGSVRKSEDRLRISVQLIDSQTSAHLWVEDYDRRLQDIFAVQSDIARSVAEALKVKLLADEASQIQKQPTKSTEAYLLYLRGRQEWNKRSEENLRKAVEDFTTAIELDPNFALAYVGLADCYNVMLDHGYIKPAEAAEKARPALLKALQLDERLAEAHAAYGLALRAYDWNWDAAEAEYKKAIELNANYAWTHQWYSVLLTIEGRLEEALDEIKKALELDPLAPMISTIVGYTLYVMEQYDDAIKYLNRALAIQPNFIFALIYLSLALAMKGEFDEAMACTEKLVRVGYPKPTAMIVRAWVLARAGKKDESLRDLDDLMKIQGSETVPPTLVASVFAELRDEEKAFEWLEKALEQRDNFVTIIKTHPLFKELRSNPRFLAIVNKLGLDRISV